MAKAPVSLSLTDTDREVLKRVQRIMMKKHGKASVTFVFREALRALNDKLARRVA